jgi:peroxiredoxin Q/BCP
MGWRLGVIRRSIIVVAAVLVLGSTATALQVGDKAPDFTLIGPAGKPVKLADLLGKGPVVIYTFIQAFSAA